MTGLAIVGASLAGLSTARAARALGYDGEITVVGYEKHRPYDRPPLSKEFLKGSMSEEDLALETEDDNLDANWQLGRWALQLDPSNRSVILDGGEILQADHVVIATGCRARRLNLTGTDLGGVYKLRTIEDAIELRAAMQPGRRMVIIGAGFIGAEIAATAKSLGLDVTVLEFAPTPLAGPLGETLGAIVGRFHEANGVSLRCGEVVDHLAGDVHVTGVGLADQSIIPADLVVVGVGAQPNVEWLQGSGLDLSNGVVCNADGSTQIPNVSAVGDCAAWLDPYFSLHRRIEHWTGAMDRPMVAMAAMLGKPAPKPVQIPYFWSDQYGARIQSAGAIAMSETVTIEEGSEDEGSLVAVYRIGDTPVGVIGINATKSFTRWRRQINKHCTENV